MIKILALTGVICQFILIDLCMTLIFILNPKWAERLSEKLFYSFADFYLAISIAGLKISLKIHYAEDNPSPPFIIIANHQSLLDILTLIWAFPRCSLRFIGKIQLQTFFPLVSTMLRIQRHVLIDRSNLKRGASQRIEKKITQLVRSSTPDRAIAVYPEGTRSRDGRVLPFRGGAVRTILKENPSLPILPVALEGGYRVATLSGIALAKKRFTYYLHTFPIQYPENKEWTREEMTEVLTASQKMIAEKIADYRRTEARK